MRAKEESEKQWAKIEKQSKKIEQLIINNHRKDERNKTIEDVKECQPSESESFYYSTNKIKLTEEEDKIPNKLWCKKQGFREGVKWAIKYYNSELEKLKL